MWNTPHPQKPLPGQLCFNLTHLQLYQPTTTQHQVEHLDWISRHYMFSKAVCKSLAYQWKNSLIQEARLKWSVSAFLSGISNPVWTAELLCRTQKQQHWARNHIKGSRHKPLKANTRMAGPSLTLPGTSVHTHCPTHLKSLLQYQSSQFAF